MALLAVWRQDQTACRARLLTLLPQMRHTPGDHALRCIRELRDGVGAINQELRLHNRDQADPLQARFWAALDGKVQHWLCHAVFLSVASQQGQSRQRALLCTLAATNMAALYCRPS